MTLEDAYAELEVDVGASESNVRQARNILLRVWHPDRHQGDPTLRAAAERKTAAINVAFEKIERAGFPDVNSFHTSRTKRDPDTPQADPHLDQLLRIRELELREREIEIKERLAEKPTTTEWIDHKVHSATKGLFAVAKVGAFVALSVLGVILLVAILANVSNVSKDRDGQAVLLFGVLAVAAWPASQFVTRFLTRPRPVRQPRMHGEPTRPAKADTTATSAEQSRSEVRGSGETPRDALRRAHDLHFSKQFEAAAECYAWIVERWPDADEARVARQQLENLRGRNR